MAVYRRIFARVGNAPDAEDLTEEVFLTALRWLRLPCARAQARAYLGATTRSVLAEHWRRHYGMESSPVLDDQDLSSSAEGGGMGPPSTGFAGFSASFRRHTGPCSSSDSYVATRRQRWRARWESAPVAPGCCSSVRSGLPPS